MKSLEDQIKVLQAQRGSLKHAFAERTGENAGKVMDENAQHEIECLEATEEILQKIAAKTKDD